jgi:hypothetical protein
MAESPETPVAEVLIDVDDWEPPALARRFKAGNPLSHRQCMLRSCLPSSNSMSLMT